MAGLTNREFKPGDDCYIVVFTPTHNKQEVTEFLEGKVKEISTTGADFPPENHPLLRYFWQTPPEVIRSIQAIVTSDPNAKLRHPADPIKIYSEPGRHYLVVSQQECVRYLKQVLGQTQEEFWKVQHTLGRVQKLNSVQLERIRNLEATLNQYQSRKFK